MLYAIRSPEYSLADLCYEALNQGHFDEFLLDKIADQLFYPVHPVCDLLTTILFSSLQQPARDTSFSFRRECRIQVNDFARAFYWDVRDEVAVLVHKADAHRAENDLIYFGSNELVLGCNAVNKLILFDFPANKNWQQWTQPKHVNFLENIHEQLQEEGIAGEWFFNDEEELFVIEESFTEYGGQTVYEIDILKHVVLMREQFGYYEGKQSDVLLNDVLLVS